MPAGIAASDRKILIIGGALLALMLVASVLLAPPAQEYNSPIPSTYSGQPNGAEAAYLLLSQMRYSVRRWEASPVDLAADPQTTLLILADPFQPPSKQEKEVLSNFIEGGGHVLFTGETIRAYFPDASLGERLATEELQQFGATPATETFSPTIPNRLAHAADRITLAPQRYWGNLKPSQLELYGGSDGPAVVSWQIGDGEILWWASSTPLTNAGITKDDNLAFFLNSLRNWSTGKTYNIYWDEYFHGQRTSLWSYVGKTSLAWGVLQIALLVLAVLITFSRRSGPVFLPRGISRLSPLEFVDTLGGLYERAGAAPSAVAVSYQRLRTLLARQLGLPSNTTDAQLGEAAEQRLGWKDADAAGILQTAAEAIRAPKLKGKAALELVQKLEHLTEKLTPHSANRKEKT